MPIEILMPALSPTMTEGNLAKWLKKEGDNVTPGDVIAEIETDKATMEVEAVDEGIIARIVVPEGTEGVPVNQLIAVLKEESDDDSSVEEFLKKHSKKPANDSSKKAEKAPAAAAPAVKSAPAPSAPVAAPARPATPVAAAPKAAAPVRTAAPMASNQAVKASPLARRIAESKGIDLSRIQGSGPLGRIVRKDVEQVAAGGGTYVSASGGIHAAASQRDANELSSLANNNIRKVIAKRLVESKQTIPHFYLNIDCELDKLLEIRADINQAASVDANGKPAYKLSVNDFIIKACALALKAVPQANASWSDEAVLFYNNVDISVAVAIDDGLITPIIRNADQKGVVTISSEMKDLAARARANKLAPEEFQGGGFSISNLGMYGIKRFQAIINPPQSCIISVGAGEKRVRVGADDNVYIANVMDITLSCDHRVVDGAVGAEFLAALKNYIENPIQLVL